MAGTIPGPGRMVAGRYLIESELGRGGMGVVWLATDELIGRQVALKELRAPAGLSAEERDTFAQRALTEARNAARIHHPNAVALHDVIPATEQDDAVYLVMELVRAKSLDKVIRAEGRLSEERVTAIAFQLLDVLDAAHALGVVHRDVKPANILLAEGDVVKLADFGIARRETDTRLTRPGLVVGTPAYLAPESLNNAPPSPAADLWSLGASLFHAVEGVNPFERDTAAGVLAAILFEEIPAPSCGGRLADAISGLVVRDPARRATSDRVREILGAAPPPRRAPVEGDPTVPDSRIWERTVAEQPPTRMTARRRRNVGKGTFALLAAGVAAVAALTTGLIVSAAHGTPNSNSSTTLSSSVSTETADTTESAATTATSETTDTTETTPTTATATDSTSQDATLATGPHYFVNDATAGCLDQDYGNGTPHADILSYPCNYDSNESWDVELNSDGSYSFTNAATGECLNQDYSGGSANSDVIAYTCGSNQNQNWRAVQVGGYIYLENEQSGGCLDQDFSNGTPHQDVLAYSPCNFASNEGWTER